MKNKYTLKLAFDNRYKNLMLFNLFFVLGLGFFMASDITSGNSALFEYLFFVLFFFLICLCLTLERYIVYRHLTKHGTFFENLKYTIIKEKKKSCILIKHSFSDNIKEIRSYRHDINDSEINKKGKINVLIDLQHPKYYYVFYK